MQKSYLRALRGRWHYLPTMVAAWLPPSASTSPGPGTAAIRGHPVEVLDPMLA
ncbi:MAG TPA: hypothetical protein VFC13_09590 [Actinomycetes bacterium]|nr:hypothetical protein [Actinomycetes bacterium]